VGFYDRDYYRSEPRGGLSSYTPSTAVGLIIAINVAVWLSDYVFQGRLSNVLAVHDYTLRHPWLWWQFLTYAFAHSPVDAQHIIFNMLGLFFLGPDVEQNYGRKEFLRVYLAIAVFAAVVWNIANLRTMGESSVIGASGAISGVVVLYALNFPHRTLLMFFIIPMPAWLVGVIIVALDMWNATHAVGSNIAYSVHLAGAAFAFVYYHRGWNFSRLFQGRLSWPKFQRKPKLRIHTPPADEKQSPNLTEEVDRILEKIYREGEASLSAAERKTLETASREYQRKKS
jgi:membrane associated rhomboid family serine protease